MPLISQIKNFLLKSFTIIVFLCAICGNYFAQNLPTGEAGKTIDSLMIALKNAKHDTTRCKILGSIIENESDDSVWPKYNEELMKQCENGLNNSKKLSPEYKFYLKLYSGTLNNAAYLAQIKGEVKKSIEFMERCLKIKEEIGEKKELSSSLYNAGYIYVNQGDYENALKYYTKCLKIQEDLGDKKAIAITLNDLAHIYSAKGDVPLAIATNEKSLKLRIDIDDKLGIAQCYGNIGVIYTDIGDIPHALEYQIKCLKIYDALGDKKSAATTYLNIGTLYLSQRDVAQALKYYENSLALFQAEDNKQGMARAINNIGVLYQDNGDPSEKTSIEESKRKGLQKAIEYYTKSLKMWEEINDKNGISQSLNNIGVIYQHISIAKSLEYFKKSLALREEIADKNKISESLNHISGLYLKQKDYPKALDYGLRAMNIAKGLGYPDNLRQIAHRLKDIYTVTGNHKLALENYELFIKMRDSLNNISTQKATIKQQTKYEYDKQKAVEDEKHLAEIKQQEEKAAADKKRQNIIIASVSVVLLLVAVFSVILFNRFRITQKQKAVIELKEKETQIQKHIIEEKHKEITDSINYAERIQRSFLATREHLDSTLSSPRGGVPERDGGGDYFVLFKPKDVVSGDFYWSASLSSPQGGGEGGGLFALCTADSTGHGVPGAIMSLLNITSLEKAIETETSPDKILNATRKIIIDRLKKDGSEQGGKDGMDCSLCVFDFKNKKLFIANANNPVWIIRNVIQSDSEGSQERDASLSLSMTEREVIEVKGDKMPVGKHDKQDIPFTLKEYNLQKGDIIYTLTDGFPDQFGGEKGKKFMSKNLRELLVANSHLPMQEQRSLLEKTFKDWVGDLEQVDDVTVIGIRI